jgi:hypothetical protein
MIIHRTYKAILIGLAITFIAAIVSFAFPNAPNYLLLPGMIVVYFVSGAYTAILVACTYPACQFGMLWVEAST